ncbi:hypothetical protein WDW86_00010 [Bdellovibrionota bacterium FG-2]
MVAIIGILTAVAIPNYQKFQAKARQTEAKVALASLYTAEKSFSSDKSSFSACLPAVGFGVETSSNRYYTVGFDSNVVSSSCGNGTQPCYADGFNPLNTTACGAAGTAKSRFDGNKAVSGASPTYNNVDLDTTTTAVQGVISTGYFRAAAGGFIGSTSSRDQWTMDQDKLLINVQSGI